MNTEYAVPGHNWIADTRAASGHPTGSYDTLLSPRVQQNNWCAAQDAMLTDSLKQLIEANKTSISWYPRVVPRHPWSNRTGRPCRLA